jgi:hypothetical protein
VLTYRATRDVPRELVRHLARLLAAERRARGTRRGTRALARFHQALLVLVWFRTGGDLTLLAAGFGISRATAYRYRDEDVTVLAARAQDLHTALRRTAANGWSHVLLDGTPVTCDRLAETTVSVTGETIDAWYSGKHRGFGANIQAVMRPDGLPIWTSAAVRSVSSLSWLLGVSVTAQASVWPASGSVTRIWSPSHTCSIDPWLPSAATTLVPAAKLSHGAEHRHPSAPEGRDR